MLAFLPASDRKWDPMAETPVASLGFTSLKRFFFLLIKQEMEHFSAIIALLPEKNSVNFTIFVSS